MHKKLKVGVIGVGHLGEHHARIYRSLDTVELVGIYDSNKERAAEIAKRYDCRAWEDSQALAGACSALSIVVPTDHHFSISCPLLKQGKHLLVEKPLVNTVEEAHILAELAQKHGALLQVGHIEHFNPVMEFLENAVQAPRYVVAERLAPYTPRGTEVGVVLDLMIHDIGIILKLMRSPVKTVEAIGVRVLSQSEDIANARVTFESGAVANLSASRISEKKVRQVRVFQEAGYLSMDFMNQTGHWVNKVEGTLEKGVIPLEKKEPLAVELEAFVKCVQEATAPKVDARFGTSALALASEITALCAQGMQASIGSA